MIAFFLYGLFMLACGLVLGATVFRDWLDRPRRAPLPRMRMRVHLDRVEAKRLELPAIKRRQQIRTVLGWERQA